MATSKKHPGGRPLKFKSVAQLEKAIAAYFKKCDSRTAFIFLKNGKKIRVPDPRPYTITGLALALETSRETLLNYEKRDEYFDTIRAAKLRCENFAEESLWTPKIAAGVIFNLTNNHGWKQKQEVDHTSGGEKIESINYVVPTAHGDNPSPNV